MKKRRIHYFFYNLWYLLTKPNRELNYLIQRMTRGWSDKDIWNFDWYLAGIIKDGLKRLKKIQTGCPNNLTEKQWDGILDNIIWTFDIIEKTESSGVEYIPSNCKDFDKFRKRLLKINKKTAKEYNISPDKILTKRQSEKLEKGLRLFIENYFNLWD